MEHRYNYFDQNPNALVNGQSTTFNHSFIDGGTQSTNNYSGSISSTSQDQSQFQERKHINPNAVPLMNSHLYQMNSNQPPRSSGPPRTNAKGIYENPQSSIPNVISLAQSNAENYPINPDFQLQPHLTGLLPQQSKSVPELYPVDNNSTSRGSIAANINTQYFASNKSYPEPKIIEYDMDETSTESSPQHTSSLYSESTDQDSECTHPSNVFSRNMLNKNTECHVTKESKTTTSLNQEFPVPSQFADLSLNRDNIDDHQHSILHNAYNQDDDDIIEDIPLSDNINQNEIEPRLGNQENPESQSSFDYYANKKDFVQTEFKYENKQSSSPISNNTTNYLPYNITNSSNIQNSSQFNKESYISQSNILTQPSSLHSSIFQPPQSKLPLFPDSNTELFDRHQDSLNIHQYNNRTLSGDYTVQDKRSLSHSTTQAQTLNDQTSCQPINSSLYNQPNVQTTESIIQDSINNSIPITSQQLTASSSLLTSTNSVGPLISTVITTTTTISLSSGPETINQENQNVPQSDDNSNNSSIDVINQDLSNMKSEFDNKFSQSPHNNLIEKQQETTIDQSKSIEKQSNESPQDNVKPQSSNKFAQPNNFFNSKNTTSQLEENYYQASINQFTPQQSMFDDNIKTSNDQLFNNFTNVSTSINDQNKTAQQSMSTSSRNVGQYFDSTNASNQFVFNQQLPNIQTYSNQQNVHKQPIKPIISSSQPSNISNNFMTFSNSLNTSKEFVSLNQQSLNGELEITEESNILQNETETFNSTVSSQSEESVPIQSNNLNVESLESTKNMPQNLHETDNVILNEQFSNMIIDNQQNIPVSQTFKQEETMSALYSSKKTFGKENPDVFQNESSVGHNVNNLAPELAKINNMPQFVTNVQSLNSDQLILKSKSESIPHLPLDDKSIPDEKPILNTISNLFPPENLSNPTQFNNELTPNVVSSASNVLSTQMFKNQPKTNTVPFLQSTPSPYLIQPFNQSMQSKVLPISSAPNQLPPQIFSDQSKASTIPSLQSTPSTVSSGSNQLPLQMFSNQPKTNTVQHLQSTPSSYPTQPFNNQSMQSTVLPVASASNQFPPQILSNQPKSDAMPPPVVANKYQSNSFNNQLTSNTALPISSTVNQFPPQMFNDQVKSETIPLLPTASVYPVQSFNNQSIQNTNPLVSNQLPPQSFSNQPTLNTISPLTSTTTSQLPPQMFTNQFKSDVSSQKTSSQYPSQPFNNQPISNLVPSVSSAVNQLPPQILSNQPKSPVVLPLHQTTNQYPPQPSNNQSRPNMIPQVSLTTNQFPPQMINNEPRFDTGSSNKMTASHRYPSQPLNNQPILDVLHIQQATNQYPQPQPFSNQSKPNMFPPSQTVNSYPSQPFSNQPGQQFSSKSPSNQFYNETNSAQLVHNQWPSHSNASQQSTTPFSNVNFSNQTNPMFVQPKHTNSASNLSSLPPSINQQTQRLGSQTLPPNPLSSNNYYNQVNNGNVQQSQPSAMLPNQNVQLTSKGYPQQSNMGISNQINYQQPNTIHGQHGFNNQQQASYRPDQNPSVVQQGFAKAWGHDNLDLLKSRDVLPSNGVQPPEIKLPQGYANCDNCSPEIIRCTLNKFPSSKNLLDKSRLPLGILIHPYKDLSRLTVIQCETITRCRYCRSYINPFVQFIDNAHWKCNLCYRVNELPGEFQIDPYTKTLGDPSRRPEIQNATIEYIASQDYMVRPPQPALYLFLLDVSRTATLTGYLEIVCDRILNKIMTDDIPGDSRTNIGFITYDSSVHFYQIANNDGGQPKQLIVSDISDIFLPLPDGLMVNLEENKSAVKDLLTSLPNLYRESFNTGCALGAALQAAFKILAPRGGRVTVFQSCLPNCGPGSLEPRDNGTTQTGDRVQHMTPSTDYYKKLALDCSAEQIAVDMFFVSSQYLDIATVSGISKYSAGCIHNFPQFDVKSPTIVTRFKNCFDRYLSRKIGFEALLRLRCTRGVAIHSFHGNFFVRSSDLLMLPNVNPDNAYGMQLSIEDSLDGVSVVCFQAALLYTSSNAERRIRVHTLCIPVTDNLNDIFHNADQQAITCLIAKMAVDRSTEKSLSDAREAFFNAISDSLSAFKVGCSSFNGPGTMLSPLSLKVFPLYILATLKHAAFRTNQPTRLDERMFSMCQMKSLPLNSLIQYIYPDLYPIHCLEDQPKTHYEKLTEVPQPPVIQLSAERIESNGIYLMDDSETLTIFIGHRCSDILIQKLFGYVNISSMPELITTLAEVDSKPSYLLRSFISYLQLFKPYPLPIEIIKENGPHKLRFYSRLIEDKFESSLSYYEFLQRLSQQVR